MLRVSELTIGFRAVRRLALTFAVLAILASSPALSSAAPVGSGAGAAAPAGWVGSSGRAAFDADTNLRALSRVSAWAIDAYLAASTTLPPLGKAFKAAEARYNLNALYLLAHAMHESGFGSSFIAQQYHNLFGWNALDRDPTKYAMRFPTFAASIDFVAEQVATDYLSPTGRFWGGAATLNGMHRYASDPEWANKIADIANRLELPTLAGRGVRLHAPTISTLSTGQTARATVTSNGSLPDGLRAAYRFVPVAIVEAGAPTGKVPAADPTFRVAPGASRDGTFRLTVTAPNRPGRYRLELELRDSNGMPLAESRVPAFPNALVRAFGSDAVVYAVAQSGGGVSIKVTNVGRREIPISGAPATPNGVALPTVLEAWLIDAAGTPTLIGSASPERTIAPGEAWTARFGPLDPATLPGMLVVRLSVGGDPGRLGGSPPGVFRLTASSVQPAPGGAGSVAPQPTPTPTATPAPTPTPAPEATPSPEATPAPATDPALPAASAAALTTPRMLTAVASPTAEPGPADAAPAAAADPNASPASTTTAAPAPTTTAPTDPIETDVASIFEIAVITPVDAASRLLVNPRWKPGKPAAAKDDVAKALDPAPRLSYLAVVNPKVAGMATLRITNIGTSPLIGPPAASQPGLPGLVPSTAPAAGAPAAPTFTGPRLAVTAVPAWGPATTALKFDVPLSIGIAPGKTLHLRVALPPQATGQSTYLIAARVITSDGTPASTTVFWLRSAVPAIRSAAGSTS